MLSILLLMRQKVIFDINKATVVVQQSCALVRVVSSCFKNKAVKPSVVVMKNQ